MEDLLAVQDGVRVGVEGLDLVDQALAELLDNVLRQHHLLRRPLRGPPAPLRLATSLMSTPDA